MWKLFCIVLGFLTAQSAYAQRFVREWSDTSEGAGYDVYIEGFSVSPDHQRVIASFENGDMFAWPLSPTDTIISKNEDSGANNISYFFGDGGIWASALLGSHEFVSHTTGSAMGDSFFRPPSIKIWDYESNTIVYDSAPRGEAPDSGQEIRNLDGSSDGKMIAYSTHGFQLFDRDSGMIVMRGDQRNSSWPLSFSADGKLLIVSSPDAILIIDVAARRILRRIGPGYFYEFGGPIACDPANNALFATTVAPAGLVIMDTSGNVIRQWNDETGGHSDSALFWVDRPGPKFDWRADGDEVAFAEGGDVALLSTENGDVQRLPIAAELVRYLGMDTLVVAGYGSIAVYALDRPNSHLLSQSRGFVSPFLAFATNSRITIRSPESAVPGDKVFVYRSDGRCYFTAEVAAGQSSVTTSALPTGDYFIVFQTASGGKDFSKVSLF